jgi:hypothetical protein
MGRSDAESEERKENAESWLVGYGNAPFSPKSRLLQWKIYLVLGIRSFNIDPSRPEFYQYRVLQSPVLLED